MNKTLLFTLLFAATSTLYAKSGCVLVQDGDLAVTWKAFKTPDKIGVSGKLPAVVYTPAAKEGPNFKTLLVGSTVTIDTTHVDSGNAPRDAKLVKFFFTKMSEAKITGKITDIQANPRKKGEPYTGTLSVSLTMNGKTVPAQMKYSYENGTFSAHGTIELADFAALDALSSINKACYDLHKGKTWSDVEIGFVTHIKATQCQPESVK